MAWVQTFEPSGWASFLAVLNPYNDTLVPGDVVNSGLIAGSFVAPAALFALGGVCALIVLARMCCCEPTRKENRGKSMIPSLTFATLSFLFTGIGVFFFLGTADEGYQTAMNTIAEAYDDTSDTTRLALSANLTGTKLLEELDNLLSVCPQARAQLEGTVTELKVQVQEYMGLLQTFYEIIKPIPPQLQRLKNGGAETVQTILLAILGVPIVFVTSNCLMMVFAVVGTACCVKSGSCFAKCEDFCLFRLGSVGLAGTILIVSAVSAMELGVGIGLSDFCGDADLNVMTVVNTTFGPGSEWYKENGDYLSGSAQYYITGNGSSPILNELADANTSLDEVASTMTQLQSLLPIVRLLCLGKDLQPIFDNITTTVAQAQSELGECTYLLGPENIYPYYQRVVHKEACSVFIDGVAWLALFQFLTGMICLPCLACRAASFVHRRTFERARTLEPDALLAADGQVFLA